MFVWCEDILGLRRYLSPRRPHWWMLCVFLLAALPVTLADNLALLSGTLRTYQRAGCDDEVVTLKCPHGTSISVQVAQYGKSAPSKALCPHSGGAPAVELGPNTTCLWPNALQYSLLQTVVEACQKKRQCKFQTSPKTFGGDPCPGVRKYVEVAYKCRPYEFRSKVACEHDAIQLKCNPNARIAVYSASYGRTEYESIQCPQPQGVPEETCLVSYATETVMQICHGKRRCSLSADAETFGNPCRPHSRMYLKVVYTCVPRKVLKERFEDKPEEDELVGAAAGDDDDDDFDGYDTDEFFRESAAFSPSPNLDGGNPHDNNLTKDPPHRTTPRPPPHAKAKGGAENQEKFYLYLILSVAAGLLVFLGLVISRLLVQRHKARREAKFHATTAPEHTLPNGFADDISEIDADIDLTTPVPVVAVHSPPGSVAEVVRFGGTLRRGDADVGAPRSLNRGGNSQYYYG